MSQQVNVGIIGCGGISPTHVNIYSQFPDMVKIVAVCDVIKERAEKGKIGVYERYLQKAKEFKDKAQQATGKEAERLLMLSSECQKAADTEVRAYVGHEELLKDDRLQAVNICTPPFAHPIAAIAAAKAKKHIFCEGPMAGTLKESDEMLAAARETQVKFSVQYGHTRFTKAAMMAKGAIESGLIGKILMGKVDVLWYREQSYYNSGAWRGSWWGERGGATFHHGRYAIDLYLWLMGNPVEVYAQMDTYTHQIEVEDCSAAVLRFGSGALGQVMASTSAQPNPSIPSQRIEIFGARASIVVIPSFQIGSAEKGYAEALKDRLEAEVTPPSLEGMAGQMKDFIDAILEDRQPIISAESTRAQIEFCRAVYKSAATAQPVKLPLLKYDPYY